MEGGPGKFCGEMVEAGAFERQLSARRSLNWEPSDVTVSRSLEDGHWGATKAFER